MAVLAFSLAHARPYHTWHWWSRTVPFLWTVRTAATNALVRVPPGAVPTALCVGVGGGGGVALKEGEWYPPLLR